jgi:hypothetical protein
LSNRLISETYRRDLRTPMRKGVMALLADKADDDGTGIYASKQTMADELCCSKQAMLDTIKAFIAEGLLIEVGHRRVANGFTVEYGIVVAALEALPMVKSHADRLARQSGTLTGQRPAPVNEADRSTSLTPPVQQVDPNPPEPSPSKASPSTEREQVRADAQLLIARVMIDIVVAGCLPSPAKPKGTPAAKRRWPKEMPPPPGVSDDQWAGLIDHRRVRRSALTPRAYELLSNRLAAVTLAEWPPGRIIDTIVERNWLSFEQAWLTRITEQENGTGHHYDRSGQRGGRGRSGFRDPLLRHYADGGDPGLG